MLEGSLIIVQHCYELRHACVSGRISFERRRGVQASGNESDWRQKDASE
jgi:hypothetical protein